MGHAKADATRQNMKQWTTKGLVVALAATLTVGSTTMVQAQSVESPRRASVAVEADILAYGIKGASGIASISFANGLQVAAGLGNYDVPAFLLEGDPNYARARWTARSTAVQVVRATYRLRGPMRNGPAIGAVVLNQRWRLSSETMSGTARFQPLSAGVTLGYYQHIGRHFYLYPTTAFTYNTVVSGSPTLGGVPYKVARFGPNASLHVGWEFSR